MSDYYALSHKLVIKTGKFVPRREYDLISFYKEVKERWKIIGVEFDTEDHLIIFHIVEE